MKRKWKIVIGVASLLLITGGVVGGVKYSRRGIVTVQTGKVIREDLSSVVTASGEIKPRNYINIGADQQGQLVEILVKEGDHVRKGQLLARVDNQQSQADVAAQRAALNSSQADAAAAEAGQTAAQANLATLQASIDRTRADEEHARLDFERTQQLFEAKLLAKQDYDTKKSAYDAAKASVQEAVTRLTQARSQVAQASAQSSGAQRKIAQTNALLSRVSDVLRKHNTYAPIDGVVTNLPVRVGETVVPGIQNSAASTIMTIADMSIITAEVKVDETDIVNVRLDQAAEVTIDAIPNKTFQGHVIEIGNTAILRSTGLAASQSTTSSQEAKDFKVVIGLDNPPDEVRPGLSATAKITTATRKNTVAVPIQALTVRQKGDLEAKKDSKKMPDHLTPAEEKARKQEITGVFVVNGGKKAEFREVKTGITGSTEIEVTNGVKEGDEIVTGTYQVIRTLRNDAVVKVDNKPPPAAKTS